MSINLMLLEGIALEGNFPINNAFVPTVVKPSPWSLNPGSLK